MKPPLILDLDGTLVDSLPGIAASLNRSLTAHGLLGHSDAAIRSFVGNGMLTLIRRAAPTGADPDLLASLARFFKADYEVSWPRGTTAYPGVPKILSDFQLDGHPLAVLSNKPHDFTVEMVSRVFPGVHFTMVLGQREGMPHKPDPSGALLIANVFGVAPEHCVVIGDSTMDLETATNAGMKAVAVAWGYHDEARLVAAGALRVAATVSELPTLVGQV